MQLMEYLPPFFSKIREYKAINEALQPEIDLLRLRFERYRKDMYFDTLTEDGCKKWEGIMGIIPPSDSTLEDRRLVIVTRYNEKLPNTWNKLLAKLEAMFGKGHNWIAEYREEYILEVILDVYDDSQYQDAVKMLDLTVPLEVILDVKKRLGRPFCGTIYCGTHWTRSTLGRSVRSSEVLGGSAAGFDSLLNECGPNESGTLP